VDGFFVILLLYCIIPPSFVWISIAKPINETLGKPGESFYESSANTPTSIRRRFLVDLIRE